MRGAKATRQQGNKATRLRGRRGLLAAALLGVLLTGCAAQPGRKAVQFDIQPWTFGKSPGHKVVTDHYEIYTTLDHRVLLEALPDFVEAAHTHYHELLPPARDAEGRMKVYMFATRPQWEAFTKRFTGSRAAKFLRVRNGGYSERGVSVIEYVSHDVTFPLFSHEGFHQYLYHHVNTRVPPWLNEGLAVCCEGQRWGSDRLDKFDPWFNPSRRNALAEALALNRLHALRMLLETDAGRVIESSDRSVATYYAQVWALVLFLQEGAGGKYRGSFERLLTALTQDGAEPHARAAHIWSDRSAYNFGEALFRSFISDDLDAVQQEYFDFMRDRFGGR